MRHPQDPETPTTTIRSLHAPPPLSSPRPTMTTSSPSTRPPPTSAAIPYARTPPITDRSSAEGYRKIKFYFQEKQCIIFYYKEKNQNLFHQYNVMYYSIYNIMYFFFIPILMKYFFHKYVV